MLTQEKLRQCISYDPTTGAFTRLTTDKFHRNLVGHLAGCVKTKGKHYRYLEIQIDGRRYMAHQLAVLYMAGEWPEHYVDHKDGNGLNNAWINLRCATPRQNSANARRQRTSTSGFKGVTFNRNAGKWQAAIRINGRQTYLGLFDKPEDAHAAYVEKALATRGEFARTE